MRCLWECICRQQAASPFLCETFGPLKVKKPFAHQKGERQIFWVLSQLIIKSNVKSQKSLIEDKWFYFNCVFFKQNQTQLIIK